MRFSLTLPQWKELRAILIVWFIIVGSGVATVVFLNLNASRIINHIEYVEASRFARTQVLYEEAKKYAEKALQEAARLNKNEQQRKPLPQDDPNFKRAVELFGKAFALDPRDPYSREMRQYYEILAHLYAAVGADLWAMKMGARGFLCAEDYKDAEIYAGSVTARDPKDYEAWMLQADAQIRAARLDDAEATILKMESAGAPPALVHELRGLVAEKRGLTQKAIAEYLLALEKVPENIDIRKRLATLLEGSKRLEEARKVLADGLALGGDRDPNYLHRLANLELKLGNPGQAVAYLERAVRMEPSSGDLYFDLAQAYQQIGKSARAYDALQEALKRNPALQAQLLSKKKDQ